MFEKDQDFFTPRGSGRLRSSPYALQANTFKDGIYIF